MATKKTSGAKKKTKKKAPQAKAKAKARKASAGKGTAKAQSTPKKPAAKSKTTRKAQSTSGANSGRSKSAAAVRNKARASSSFEHKSESSTESAMPVAGLAEATAAHTPRGSERKRINWGAHIQGPGILLVGARVWDVTPSGAFVECPEGRAVAVGVRIAMTLFPFGQARGFDLQASVRWVGRSLLHRSYGLGVAFEDLPARLRNVIEEAYPNA